MRKVIAVCLSAAPMVCSPALASDFKETIYEYLNRPQDQIEDTYPLVRCAGLYFGVYNIVGEDQLGDQTAKNIKTGIDIFTQSAALIRAENGAGTIEDIGQSVLRDALAISDIYIQRMKSNYQSTGVHITEDPLISGDMVVCRALLNAE